MTDSKTIFLESREIEKKQQENVTQWNRYYGKMDKTDVNSKKNAGKLQLKHY